MPPVRFKYFDLFVNAFVTVLLVSNLIAQKICVVGPFWPFSEPFYVSGAQALFPLTYIFGDVFTEVYGYTASKRAIWTGFFASILMACFSALAVWLPPRPFGRTNNPPLKCFLAPCRASSLPASLPTGAASLPTLSSWRR